MPQRGALSDYYPMHSESHSTIYAILLALLLPLATSARANLVPEGAFESGLGADGNPKGWTIDPIGWKNSPNLSVNLLSELLPAEEGGRVNNFVRLGNTGEPDEEGVFRLSVVKPLPRPAPARITVGWRVRAAVEATSRVHGWSSVQLTIRFLNAKGRELFEKREIFRLVRSTQDRWLERETIIDVPDGTTDIELLPGLYLVRGSVDLDDITVRSATD